MYSKCPTISIPLFYFIFVCLNFAFYAVMSEKLNICVLNVIIYNKAAILVAVHFLMQNTDLSPDLDSALWWGCLSIHPSLFTYVCMMSVTYFYVIKCGKSA